MEYRKRDAISREECDDKECRLGVYVRERGGDVGVSRNKGVDTKLAAFAESKGQSSRY